MDNQICQKIENLEKCTDVPIKKRNFFKTVLSNF